MKIAFLIADIREYGQLMSYCIENDICVFRTYWDDRQKGKRVYFVDFKEKRCYYSDVFYYDNKDFEIVHPVFVLDKFGRFTPYV